MWADAIKIFIRDESGATAIEYALLATMTSLVLLASFTLVGNSLVNLFNNGTAEVIGAQAAKVP